jgi:hypothetical protein
MSTRKVPAKLSGFPVDVLTNNIVHELENAALRSNHSMAKSVSEGLVHDVIQYDNDGKRPRPPGANLDTRMIHVQQSYLAYLWAFAYSSFVVFEQYIQKSAIEGAWVPMNDLLRGAEALWQWAVRFAQDIQPWDPALPSPTREGDELQQAFVRKTNEVVVRAMTYLLLHEYAHLTLKHTLTADGQWMIEQETDADNFARSFLLDDASSEEQRLVAGLSIVLVTTSSLFLATDFMDIWKSKHPHAIDRIRHAVSGLNLSTQKSKDYLYLLSAMQLGHFLAQRNISVPLERVDTPEHALLYLLDRCDEVRARTNMKGAAKTTTTVTDKRASKRATEPAVPTKDRKKTTSVTPRRRRTPARKK